MKGSLIIVGFFVLGTICGVCHLLPFDIAETNISYYALCALMFSSRSRIMEASSTTWPW
jgi:hypothetical protein